MNKKIVLVFGTFDFLHIGHISFFKNAKKKGERLVVAVAKDAAVKQLKGRVPIHNEEERKKLVSELACVDAVLFGDSEISKYDVLKQVKPDVIATGYDQQMLEKDVRKYIRSHGLTIAVARIPAYKPKTKKSNAIKRALQIV